MRIIPVIVRDSRMEDVVRDQPVPRAREGVRDRQVLRVREAVRDRPALRAPWVREVWQVPRGRKVLRGPRVFRDRRA